MYRRCFSKEAYMHPVIQSQNTVLMIFLLSISFLLMICFLVGLEAYVLSASASTARRLSAGYYLLPASLNGQGMGQVSDGEEDEGRGEVLWSCQGRALGWSLGLGMGPSHGSCVWPGWRDGGCPGSSGCLVILLVPSLVLRKENGFGAEGFSNLKHRPYCGSVSNTETPGVWGDWELLIWVNWLMLLRMSTVFR